MRDLAFKTYLIGQCSKLAQEHELTLYRSDLTPEFWKLLGREALIEETSTFANALESAEIFESLSSEALKSLTQILSRHHRNGVFENILKFENWIEKSYPFESVEMGYVECELREVISSCRHDLLKVAESYELRRHPHYSERDLTREVPYDVFLAKFSKTKFPQLIDGNHRAIHMGRQFLEKLIQKTSLRIVVPDI